MALEGGGAEAATPSHSETTATDSGSKRRGFSKLTPGGRRKGSSHQHQDGAQHHSRKTSLFGFMGIGGGKASSAGAGSGGGGGQEPSDAVQAAMADAVPPPANLENDKKAAHAASQDKKAILERYEVNRSHAPDGYPDIALIGVEHESFHELGVLLRKRGFVIHLAIHRTTGKYDLGLAIGPKLASRLAVEEDVPLKPLSKYTYLERGTLAGAALKVLARAPIKYSECFLLHAKEGMPSLTGKNWRVDRLAEYWGSGVGMYFAWLSFYTKSLLPLGVVGLVLTILTFLSEGADASLTPIYCVVVALWSVLYIEGWKRQNAKVAFKWGVLDLDNEEELQDLAAKVDVPHPSPLGRLMLSFPIHFFSMASCVSAMLYCIDLSDNAEEYYGEDSYMKYWPTLLYSIVPIAMAAIYSRIARWLVNKEGENLESKRRNSLILKEFTFQCINYFCALFYIAFWLQDMERLQQMLFSLTITKQIVGNVQELLLPKITAKAKAWWLQRSLNKAMAAKAAEEEKRKQQQQQEQQEQQLSLAGDSGANKDPAAAGPGVAPLPATIATTTPQAPPEDVVLLDHPSVLSVEEFNEQIAADEFEAGDEYLEMAVQFGFSTMFAIAFPMAPLLAFMNNVAEMWIDSQKLKACRRPVPSVCSNIGAWQTCIEIMSLAATITNCSLVVLMGHSIDIYTPGPLTPLLESLEGKIILAVFLEHILLGVRFILSEAVDDKPTWIRTRQAKEQVEAKEASRKTRLAAYQLQSESGSDRISPEEKKRQAAIAALRKASKDAEASNMVPKWLLASLAAPLVAIWLGWSLWWGLLISIMIISFMQHTKDKNDVALAMGIVSDANVLKLVTQELPSWFHDSEVERVEWINKIMQKFWIPASGAMQGILGEVVQPILDEYKPAGVSELGFSKATLGTIPPKVVGMRVMDMAGSTVVLDAEVKWAGNAKFVFSVGRQGVKLNLTTSHIRFSGKMRIELGPLVPKVPCVGAVAFCFMEKPFVDFKFKIQGLDVMSIGPGDANLAGVVSATIKSVIETMMLYPKKMVIPVMDEVEMALLANPAPKGLLQLTLVGCDNLRKADLFGKSDPFVVFKVGLETQKSRVISNNLNPRWDKEEFIFLVHDKGVQDLSMEVYDEDPGGAKESLGDTILSLTLLETDTLQSFNIPLSNTRTGSILVKCRYLPLQPEENDDDDDDVIFRGKPGGDGMEIDDDLVATSAYNMGATSETGKRTPTRLGAAAKAVVASKAVGSAIMPTEPQAIDSDIGVLTIMNLEYHNLKGNKVSFIEITQGNFSTRTREESKKPSCAFDDVIHTIVRSPHHANLTLTIVEKGLTGSSELGQVKIPINEIIINEGVVDGEWDIEGEKATQGQIKARLIFFLAQRKKKKAGLAALQ